MGIACSPFYTQFTCIPTTNKEHYQAFTSWVVSQHQSLKIVFCLHRATCQDVKISVPDFHLHLGNPSKSTVNNDSKTDIIMPYSPENEPCSHSNPCMAKVHVNNKYDIYIPVSGMFFVQPSMDKQPS